MLLICFNLVIGVFMTPRFYKQHQLIGKRVVQIDSLEPYYKAHDVFTT